MQPPPSQNPEKEEGPAEAAPEENRPVDLEPLTSYPEQTKRKMQIFELGGYLRLRDDYMHDFFLGLGYSHVLSGSTVQGTTNYGLPPFPLPLDCPSPANAGFTTNVGVTTVGPTNAFQNCPTKSVGGANLRFRLEPTLNVTDQVRVHAQIDVLDNTIMGSTPDSLAGIQGFNVPPAVVNGQQVSPTSLPGVAPSGFVSTTQDPPEIGQNGFTSSIRAKRAWAEIDTEFGSIYFGRMPWNWGRGHLLQRRQLRRLRRWNDGRSGDGDDHHLRPSAEVRLGPWRAGDHDATAVAGAARSERLPVRPVAERRRPAADGVGGEDRQPGRAARADRSRRRGRQLRPAGRLPEPGEHRRAPDDDAVADPVRAAAGDARPAPDPAPVRRLLRHARRLVQALLQGADHRGRGDRHPRSHRSPGRPGRGRTRS